MIYLLFNCNNMIIFLVYNIKCLLLFFSKYLNTSNLIIFLKIEFYEYF